MKILGVLFIVYFIYTSVYDYLYQKHQSRIPAVFMSVVSLVMNLIVTDNILFTFIAFLSLSSVFYLVCMVELSKREDAVAFGTIDLLIAPSFTVWFGEYIIIYLLIFLVLYLLFQFKFIRKFLSRNPISEKYSSLIPLLFINFIIGIMILPNNFVNIFSS